ncbi:MAG: hypothetical protein R3E68_09665 [Burkholderiaceae bacterium]
MNLEQIDHVFSVRGRTANRFLTCWRTCLYCRRSHRALILACTWHPDCGDPQAFWINAVFTFITTRASSAEGSRASLSMAEQAQSTVA